MRAVIRVHSEEHRAQKHNKQQQYPPLSAGMSWSGLSGDTGGLLILRGLILPSSVGAGGSEVLVFGDEISAFVFPLVPRPEFLPSGRKLCLEPLRDPFERRLLPDAVLRGP